MNDNESNNGTNGAMVNVDAVANLPQDLAILKIENDSIMSLATARPRDMVAIKKDLEGILDAFPALAEEAIYNKPVGKDPATGQQKYARNLSVRAAEAIAEAYGFNRIRADVTFINENRVRIDASFTDFQRGRIWSDSTIVSRFYKAKNGGMVAHPEDRFLNVVIKAEKSKVVREVITRSVNPGLKAWFWDKCEKVIDGLLDDKTVDKIVGQFSSKGVSLEQLEALLMVPRRSGWTMDHRKTLLGVWNALRDGETTISEAFGTSEPKPATAPTGDGGQVSGADFTSPKADGNGKPAEPKQEEKPKQPEPPKEEPKAKKQPDRANDDTLAALNAEIKRLALSQKTIDRFLTENKVSTFKQLSQIQAEKLVEKLADEPSPAEALVV